MFEKHTISELASNFINTTNRHVFLTGKAGTGKTTFLKHIIEHSHKNAVITAPTGIAAINAGGVTLHSLLQLPFGTFIPQRVSIPPASTPINTPQTLFKQTRFNAAKRKLINELELLVIDEVSMLRADLLDCIDHSLRYLRKRRSETFGGLQILFIGDLMQLPPVAKGEEASILAAYYPSLYFFEAKALQSAPPVTVEFKKIFRQQDQKFIDLLNRVRNNQQTNEDIKLLNSHFNSTTDPKSVSGFIHLTTHNRKADAINQERLVALPHESISFDATTSGDFPDTMMPTNPTLVLKKEAQVMFIKNDPTGEAKFFNGKIGRISQISTDGIKVAFEDGNEIDVSLYKWENKRYTLKKETLEIEEKFVGSFEQYPLKLAWAVTIHKSQGLTFEKAILDLSGTFAPGQLYVALSRLTSLDGLVLSSPLPLNPPPVDEAIRSFLLSFKANEKLSEQLVSDRKGFIMQLSKRVFGFESLMDAIKLHKSSFNKAENRSLKQQYIGWTESLLSDTAPLVPISQKFIQQIEHLLRLEDYLSALNDRMEKAQSYFELQLTNLKKRIADHRDSLKSATKVKTYLKELEDLEGLFLHKNQQILKMYLMVFNICNNKEFSKTTLKSSPVYQLHIKANKKIPKKDKIPTAQISYELYKQGKNIDEIASTRGLVPGTIEGHICAYVENGMLEVTEFLKSDRLNTILEKFHKGATGIGDLKSALNSDFSYSEIKLALAHIKCMENAT